MPNCQQCSTYFPNWITIDGKRRNVSSRKFCLTCSPFGQHNTSKNPSISREVRKKERYSKQGKYVSDRRRKVVAMAVEYLGGKCKICGYDKCVEALDFHHVDPSTKSFNISRGNTISWEKIKEEVDKCVLLCANCHREVEAGVTVL